jgi:hypothetical protein
MGPVPATDVEIVPHGKRLRERGAAKSGTELPFNRNVLSGSCA